MNIVRALKLINETKILIEESSFTATPFFESAVGPNKILQGRATRAENGVVGKFKRQRQRRMSKGVTSYNLKQENDKDKLEQKSDKKELKGSTLKTIRTS